MDCKGYAHWFSSYIDGLLAAHERTQFEGHLQSCERCRVDLASLRQMLAVLQTMESPAVPNLLPGVQAKLARAPWWQGALARLTALWPSSAPLQSLALATTAALVLAVVVVPRLHQHRTTGDESGRTETFGTLDDWRQAMPQQKRAKKPQVAFARSNEQERASERNDEDELVQVAALPKDARLGEESQKREAPEPVNRQVTASETARGGHEDVGERGAGGPAASPGRAGGDALGTLGDKEGRPREYRELGSLEKKPNEALRSDHLMIADGKLEVEPQPATHDNTPQTVTASATVGVTVTATKDAVPAVAATGSGVPASGPAQPATPPSFEIQWRVASIQDTATRVAAWVNEHGGQVVMHDAQHVEVRLASTDVASFLQVFSPQAKEQVVRVAKASSTPVEAPSTTTPVSSSSLQAPQVTILLELVPSE